MADCPSPLSIAPKNRFAASVDPKVWNVLSSIAKGYMPWPLFMFGPTGSGKTSAVLCLLDLVSESRRYATAGDFLMDSIRAKMGELRRGDYLISEAEFWKQWRDYGITCLDEIGARDKVTDHHYETVKRAIDDRQDKPCIFVSNIELDQIAKLYDDRIASRLGAGTILHAIGTDRRLKSSMCIAT